MSSSAFRIFIRHCGREAGQPAMVRLLAHQPLPHWLDPGSNTLLACAQVGSACDLLYLKTLREFGLQRGHMSFEAFCFVTIRAAKQFHPTASKESLASALIAMTLPTANRKSISVDRCLLD